jgi:formylglycine-generating enzyme required for sulfatase activity
MRLLVAILISIAVGAFGSAMGSEPGMVRIAGGTFIMGSNDGLADERPAHSVTLKAFWIDRRPVTNAEFAAFLEKLGSTSNARGQHLFDWDDGDARIHKVAGRWRADRGFEDHPANEMTWYGARDYCAALGKRLPSEAEREFAARGPPGRTYPWGEAPPDPTRARYGVGWIQTIPAGVFARRCNARGRARPCRQRARMDLEHCAALSLSRGRRSRGA